MPQFNSRFSMSPFSKGQQAVRGDLHFSTGEGGEGKHQVQR